MLSAKITQRATEISRRLPKIQTCSDSVDESSWEFTRVDESSMRFRPRERQFCALGFSHFILPGLKFLNSFLAFFELTERKTALCLCVRPPSSLLTFAWLDRCLTRNGPPICVWCTFQGNTWTLPKGACTEVLWDRKGLQFICYETVDGLRQIWVRSELKMTFNSF